MTGSIKTISDEREGGASINLTHEYGFYKSFSHNETQTVIAGNSEPMQLHIKSPWLQGTAKSSQNGGAYIFRPLSDELFVLHPITCSIVVYETDIVKEVHAQFGDPSWITHIIRLVDGKDYVEIEYAVGPVPIEDGVGKEVVSRYSTSVESRGYFYTDSNGREFIKRKRGDERVAGNYYPVTASIFIEDQITSFSVLVDRSQGGASLSDGSLELLIHRRLVQDDARGVGEALNETDLGISPYPPFGNSTRLGSGIITKGMHRLMIGMKGASKARSQMDTVFSQPHIFVASAPNDIPLIFHQPDLTLLNASLPENVMVVTFSALKKANLFLVRLAHQYGIDESHSLSSPVYVDLQSLFQNQFIESITEKTLSANQDRAKWERKRLRWTDYDMNGVTKYCALDSGHLIELKPLEIRTFEIRILPITS